MTEGAATPKPRCGEQWHPSFSTPTCEEDAGHDGRHKGYGMSWATSPRVDVETAQKFLGYYRRVPNHYHQIDLLDDGTVTMGLGDFGAATVFINTRTSD